MGDSLQVLGEYRGKDEKTQQGEAIPEKETLNSTRLQDFLDKGGYTAENFDTRFNQRVALEILDKGGTKGELEMAHMIREGQAYFEKIGLTDFILETNEKTFNSNLQKELMRRNEMDKEAKLRQAHLCYMTVRDLCYRKLRMNEKFVGQREEEKVSAEKGIKEQFTDTLKDIKKNYNKMSSGEKLVVVGGLLAGTIWFATSDKTKDAREKIWGAMKFTGGMAAGGITLNYLVKLFTGKSGVDTLKDWSKNNVDTDSFWTDTFKTTPENAECVRKSTVYMGNLDFNDLAKKYQDAKASGEKKISLATVKQSDMTPEEIYTALETFFSRYPVEALITKYRNAKQKLNWTQVVSTEMAEDGMLEFKGNLAERAIDGATEYGNRLWNGFWVTTEGIGLMRPLYLKVRGTKGSDQEVREWGEKYFKEDFKNEVMKPGDVPGFIEKKFSPQSAPHFKRAFSEGTKDPVTPSIRFVEVPGDSLYIVNETSIDMATADEKKIGEMVNGVLSQTEDFLKRKYPDIKDTVFRFLEVGHGVRVAEGAKYLKFFRIPVKGSPEYSRKAVMLDKPPVRDEKATAEVFGPESVLSYKEWAEKSPWKAERLRVRFQMDDSQTEELQKICQWFTDKYKLAGMKPSDVEKKLFESDDDRRAVLDEVKLSPKLSGNEALYKEIEVKLLDIEKSKSEKFDSSTLGQLYPPNWFKDASDPQMMLAEQMRRNLGYKVRLAVLGDSGAIAYFKSIDPVKYDPNRREGWIKEKMSKITGSTWMSDLISDYEEKCNKLVKDYSNGTARFEK